MEIIIGLFGIVIAIFVFGFIINGTKTVIENKLGVRYVSKWSVNQKARVEQSNQTCKTLIEHETRTNPELVKLATSNLNKKGHALTFPSVFDEIVLIRKNNPSLYPEKSGWEREENKELTALFKLASENLAKKGIEFNIGAVSEEMELIRKNNPEHYQWWVG